MFLGLPEIRQTVLQRAGVQFEFVPVGVGEIDGAFVPFIPLPPRQNTDTVRFQVFPPRVELAVFDGKGEMRVRVVNLVAGDVRFLVQCEPEAVQVKVGQFPPSHEQTGAQHVAVKTDGPLQVGDGKQQVMMPFKCSMNISSLSFSYWYCIVISDCFCVE